MKSHQLAVLNFMKDLKPGRLLDAGSGGDSLGLILKDKGFDVFSLDLYEKTRLKGRFTRADLNGNLPFASASFDYILCCESLQYLENHAGLFREFRRILKADGSAVLSIPNVLSANSRLYFLQRGYYPHFKPVRTIDASKKWDSIAYHPVSFVDILESLKRNNFKLKALKASRMKASNLPLYLFLKALYSLGLLFESHKEKAELLRHLSSREVLLGDHLVIHIEQKRAA
ncbi:MAG: class I SAM-dependent methyltransferase [Deltaproteobacteria bacterium]|nr:class I SAM-dependent methyltransferase [Deltaproteobacteria bacterium]